jgi:hypothetical protein
VAIQEGSDHICGLMPSLWEWIHYQGKGVIVHYELGPFPLSHMCSITCKASAVLQISKKTLTSAQPLILDFHPVEL